MLQFYIYNCDGQYSLALSLMFDDYRVGTIIYIWSTIFTTSDFNYSFHQDPDDISSRTLSFRALSYGS